MGNIKDWQKYSNRSRGFEWVWNPNTTIQDANDQVIEGIHGFMQVWVSLFLKNIVSIIAFIRSLDTQKMIPSDIQTLGIVPYMILDIARVSSMVGRKMAFTRVVLL